LSYIARVLDLGLWLERGGLGGRWPQASSLLAGGWRLANRGALGRRLEWPRGTRVVAVGGATLGGSFKTPVAIACAAECASQGIPTALVGHAYRGVPGAARLVTGDEPIEEVGDEALLAARLLRGSGALVVVGPTRRSAVELAARHARVLVLDGVSQTAPRRASLAVLAVDAQQPWGRMASLPPRGDLRASPAELIEACDVVVPVCDASADLDARNLGVDLRAREVWPSHAASAGATGEAQETGARLSWQVLQRTAVGLVTMLARADRVVRSLESRGVHPRVVLRGPDHGPLGPALELRAAKAAKELGLGLWLATAKCSLHIEHRAGAQGERAAQGLGARVATLDYGVKLDPRLRARLQALG
jgi:tetraacyldisaccharide 4'-kinase